MGSSKKKTAPKAYGFDIEEFCAIEAFKRGERERLVHWWEHKKWNVPSARLHAFIGEVLQGKALRGRGRPKTKNSVFREWTAQAQVRVASEEERSKKVGISVVAKKIGLSTDRIEQLVYPSRSRSK